VRVCRPLKPGCGSLAEPRFPYSFSSIRLKVNQPSMAQLCCLQDPAAMGGHDTLGALLDRMLSLLSHPDPILPTFEVHSFVLCLGPLPSFRVCCCLSQSISIITCPFGARPPRIYH
jgi:hypothetical protein